MRKIILAVSIVLLCAACGGDGSSLDPVQPNPSTEQNAAEVTNDDIVKFLNLDKQQNVYQALETAKASLGNRTVNGKALNVTAIDVLNSDEEKGTFTLRVMGNSSGKTFTKDVEYAGFAQKPNDYEMVSRAVAAWKTDVNYLKDFDFDTLYRLKDNSKFTTAYLQKFINLSSSSVGGSKHYTFTPADWANTTVSDVRYVGSNSSGQVAFTITYKGRKNSSLGVEMNKNEYYRNQISVNTEGLASYICVVCMSVLMFSTPLCLSLIVRSSYLILRASVETMVQTLSRSLSNLLLRMVTTQSWLTLM